MLGGGSVEGSAVKGKRKELIKMLTMNWEYEREDRENSYYTTQPSRVDPPLVRKERVWPL